MSGGLKERLLEQLEEQAAFGPLPLPAGVDRRDLTDPARLQAALERRRERILVPPDASLAETVAGLRGTAPVPPATSAPSAAPPAMAAHAAPLDQRWASLEEVRAAAAACALCDIAARRTHSVFGVGAPDADLVIVGEAPGEQEDLKGEPFVGPAGQLLDKMLAAIGFARTEVYICNTLKCRPTGNRDPQPEELVACRPFLDHQLHLLKPRIILALGRVAARALLGGEGSLASMRGREHAYRGIPLRVTYHPAALLRNLHWKKPALEDLMALRQRYDELGGSTPSLPVFKPRH
jgi:uracil-DNA glycosylase